MFATLARVVQCLRRLVRLRRTEEEHVVEATTTEVHSAVEDTVEVALAGAMDAPRMEEEVGSTLPTVATLT